MSTAGPPTILSPAPDRLLGRVSGPRPGPTLVVVGGLHGNEPAGLEAADRVLASMRSGDALERGTFVALRGHIEALWASHLDPRADFRYIDRDLNRSFVDDVAGGADPGAVEWRERDELRAALDEIDRESDGPCALIDLHTVSSPSPPFVAVEDSIAARRLAMRLGLPLILGMEEELDGLLIDDVTRRLGWIGAIVESGQHDDPRSVDVHEAVIRLALDAMGMSPADARAREVVGEAAGRVARHVYDVRFRAEVGDASFRTHDAAAAFMRVRAHETVVATESGREIIAQESGRLFMPNRQRTPRVGDDAYFVVRRVGRSWLSLSSWLRRRPWLHAAVPSLLPGVRRRPGHPGDLLVSPDVSAVLRRQILHLLGYRLVRFTAQPGVPLWRRVLAGTGVLAHAVGMIVLGAFRGGERAALPEETERDWIVRRRVLDLEPRLLDERPASDQAAAIE